MPRTTVRKKAKQFVLHVEYKRTLLASYHYRLKRGSTQIGSISNPRLYRTQFVSPQLELLVLDDEQ